MWTFITGTFGKWFLGTVAGVTLLFGLFVYWHKNNFTCKAEVRYWQEYSDNLILAVEKQKRLLREYEAQKQEHEAQIDELEKEREQLLEEDRERDDGVVLDHDDLERLRQFQRR